jgi:uncharacterized protein YbjT (DUF2867 family)
MHLVKEFYMDKKDKIILVTGATGKQGGAVLRHLLEDGWSVRALTRSPDKNESEILRNLGAEIVQGDLDNPDSLTPALAGVYGVFSVQQFWGKGVDVEVAEGMALADAAKKAGVAHFIYSSIGGAERKTGIPFFESKFRIETYIKKLNLKWSIVRPAYFMENFLIPDMISHLYNGDFPFPLETEMSMQLLAVDDIGEMVKVMFNNPEKYLGKAIEIAGDELTGAQMAETLSKATGKTVTYREIPVESLHEKSADYEMMFDWMNRRGFAADIESLKEKIPTLKTLETWAETIRWEKKEAA